jgi:hypothetical protein
MPQPKQPRTNAQRQAAFRSRKLQELAALHASKGLPALPVIPTIPGWRRWRQVLGQAEDALRNVHDEMQSYYDERSEDWQQSGNADEFTAKMEAVEELVDHVAECRGQIG